MWLPFVVFGFCLAGPMVLSQKIDGPLDNYCLGCLCEAASGCNMTLGCNGDVCGPFRITHAYWIDAGKPVIDLDDPNDPSAYARCTNEPFCAGRAVQQYMSRFQQGYGEPGWDMNRQDCNGDGVINCLDFVSIHHLGGYGCNSGTPWNKAFEIRFFQCLTAVQNLIQTRNGEI